MTKIQILDCTLRDGGYINNFKFGKNCITKIISQLTLAGLDVIEVGFLEDGEYSEENSIYNMVEQISAVLPVDKRKSMYVAMACYGEYDLSQLSPYDGTSIEGIRVTFHYNEIEEALEYCRDIQKKGYKVFVQPVGTSSYTDKQLLSLIQEVNEMRPYAFYLVDTLGLMDKDELLRFFYLINHNLANGINMGFHSHNNLQLSFSNCQALTTVESDRTISLDSSVYGMGRGAGNLNTELIANYLNNHCGANYVIEPVLEVVDEYISKIREKYNWGYSVPYYLAAINGCHPNYASYLNSKNTLNVKSISTILRMIEPEKRSLFDKNLVEKKYLEFQSNEIDDTEAINRIRRIVESKNVLLLAPGISLNENCNKIISLAKEQKCIVISVSFVPDFIDTDYVFLSNLKRYETTFNLTKKKIDLITTSNIKVKETDNIIINYSSLLNTADVIRDNSCLMLLTLLSKLVPARVYIAGMDGYKDSDNNYYREYLAVKHNVEQAHILNEAISRRLEQLNHLLDIEFITPTLYIK